MSFDLKIRNGDLQLGANNDLAKVENTEKLVQEIIKMISTPLGANPFFSWYGCPITRTLIGTAYTTRFISNIASNQLRTSLETLQKLQKTQLRSGQFITPQEQLAAIQNVLVDRNSVDPRFFLIDISVLDKTFRTVPTYLRVSL